MINRKRCGAIVAGLLLLCQGATAEEGRQTLPLVGVNFAGAAFGAEKIPGRPGWEYFYPDLASIGYFAAKGAKVIRLCVLWERLQPQLDGDLSEPEMNRIDAVIANAHIKGMRVLLDIHNYASFAGSRIGSDQVSIKNFADLWKRIAARYRNDPSVMFGLMNEPIKLPTETWLDATNAAIKEIRAAGAGNLIMVPGNGWSSARDWFSSSYGSPNAGVMQRTADPQNNFVYEVHQYFDPDATGTHGICIDSASATAAIAPFTAWARKNGRKAFLGEFGVGADSNCLRTLQNLLEFMQENRDVWIGWTYWAAGPWAKDYFTNIGPDNGADRPQMTILQKFMASAGKLSFQRMKPSNRHIAGVQSARRTYRDGWRRHKMRWNGPVATIIFTALFSGNLSAQGFTENNVADHKHLDYAGKPCLTTSGASSPLASNPRIMNHAVNLDNHCVDRIRAKVCYYKTDECTDVVVPGNSRIQQIIGVFPAMQLFRYEVREQF